LIAYDKDSASFEKTVEVVILNQNDEPRANEVIGDMIITTNRLTSVEIEKEWFVDEDEADSLIYHILSATGDTIEWATVTGNTTIEFNPRSLGGTNHSFILVATDSLGAEVKSSFDLEILVVTGVEGLSENFSIYPNPTTNWISWYPDTRFTHVSVYNLNGKVVINQLIESNHLNIECLFKGTYIMELKGEGVSRRVKFAVH